MKEELVGRWLFTSEGLQEGHLRLVDGHVEEICLGAVPTRSAKALVLQSLVNSHVHLGDSVAYPAPKGSVQELVGPPDGHKYRILESKSRSEKVAAMRNAIALMRDSATSVFGDFREEGIDGIRMLRTAVEGSGLQMRVFGRPNIPNPDDSQIDALLGECHGIGMSALSDWDYGLLRTLSMRAKSSGKLFAMHASESRREDISRILDLKPNFLVHMCKATDDDVQMCIDDGVPIVVCPRSNEFFGLDPDIPRLLRLGATLALGTDNGMVVRPDMLEEMKACYGMCKARGGASPEEIVRLATSNGRKVLNAEPQITTEITEKSDLVAVRVRGENPLLELVTESRAEDILGVARGGKFGRTSAWTR